MARYVVPVVVLLALVGGYVVGQQPETVPGETVATPPAQVIWAAPPAGQLMLTMSSQVGRYVPFEGGKMLDTTNGTLYRIDADAWVDVVKMKEVSNPEHSASLHHRVFDALVEDGCDLSAKGWTGKSGKQYSFAIHGGCPSAGSIELIKDLADMPPESFRLRMMMVDSEDFTPEAEAALDTVFKHKDKIGTRARLYSNSPLPKQPGSN